MLLFGNSYRIEDGERGCCISYFKGKNLEFNQKIELGLLKETETLHVDMYSEYDIFSIIRHDNLPTVI